jgi:hypothetical protein
MDKWDYMKLKWFCTKKEMVFKPRRTPTEWEKYLLATHQTKGWYPEYTGSLKKLNSPKINEPKKKWKTERNKNFSKEEIQMDKKKKKKHVKKCS